jgi:hypothetical protein
LIGLWAEGRERAGGSRFGPRGELGRARRAGPVGKEEGGWAGGLKGRGEELRVWEVFF